MTYTVIVETYFTGKTESGMTSNRVNKEFYKDATFTDARDILASWSDEDDLVKKWYDAGEGNFEYSLSDNVEEGNFTVKVQVIKVGE